MKWFVTGAAGYLGSVLVEELLLAGHHVVALDTFAHGNRSLAALMHRKELTLVRADAREISATNTYVQEADMVVPLAAIVGAPACDAALEEDVEETNIYAVTRLVDRLAQEQRVLYPNSNSGYGTTPPGTECTEDMPLHPVSLYGETKHAAEKVVLRHPRATVFRFATLFGGSHRMRLDLLVNDFTLRAVRDRCVTLFEPEARRNFLHVRDAARAFLHAAERDDMCGQTYNCGLPDANLTKRELCERIRDVVGHDFAVNVAATHADPDRSDYVVSNAKLLATGWRPRYSLTDGIEELAEMFRALPFASENRNVW